MMIYLTFKVLSKVVWLEKSTIYGGMLTLKTLVTTAADDILIILTNFRENKTGISCELSARQTVHMKCHFIFSEKKEESKCVLQL